MKSYGDNRGECNRPKWVKASEFCIIHISIYTLSDLVDLSNLIGALSRTIQQYSLPGELDNV